MRVVVRVVIVMLFLASLSGARERALMADLLWGGSSRGVGLQYSAWTPQSKGWDKPFLYGIDLMDVPKRSGRASGEYVAGSLGYAFLPAISKVWKPMLTAAMEFGAENVNAADGSNYVNGFFGYRAQAGMAVHPNGSGLALRIGAFNTGHMNADLGAWALGLVAGLGWAF